VQDVRVDLALDAGRVAGRGTSAAALGLGESGGELRFRLGQTAVVDGPTLGSRLGVALELPIAVGARRLELGGIALVRLCADGSGGDRQHGGDDGDGCESPDHCVSSTWGSCFVDLVYPPGAGGV